MTANLPVQAYAALDGNTADVYMTDLPPAALQPDGDLSNVWGQFVHLHLFVSPKAGQTPIANSACSVTVRHVVIARGQIGVYGGGGFLIPGTDPGDDYLTGSIRGATCRLVALSPGFVDRLGASEFRTTFKVPKDDAQARELAARLSEILGLAKPLPAPLPAR